MPDDFTTWLILDNGSKIPLADYAEIPIPDNVQSAVLAVGTRKFLDGEGISGLPQEFALEQNFPNPFNPSTAINFALPSPARIKLEIFNILGRSVRTLLDNEYPAGYHDIIWDGNDSQGNPVASGIYLYRLSSGETNLVRKMVLLK